MKRFPHLLLTAVTLAGLSLSTFAATARKPNILIIVADDLGYGELSVQGYTQEIHTPNLDALANGGIRFTSGYVSGPYCSPTRAGLMTGRYQQRYGHEFNPGPAENAPDNFGLSLDEKTIGDRLKTMGYATAWFGKSHLGYLPPYHPLKRGFDEYFGFLGGAHDYLDAEADAHNPILKGTTPVNNIGYTTDAFGEQAVTFIDKHKTEPWLCYLAFNAVHAPLESTEKYLSRFSNIDNKKRRTYAAMTSAMDDAVGAVAMLRSCATRGRRRTRSSFSSATTAGRRRRRPRAMARCAASRRRLGRAASACRGPCIGKGTSQPGKWTTGQSSNSIFCRRRWPRRARRCSPSGSSTG